MAGTYNIQQTSQSHVKDKNGQDIDGLCIWCYRITYDSGGPRPDKDALDGDWRLEGISAALDPTGPELTGATVDPATVPKYTLNGKNVEVSKPPVHPDATDKAPPNGFGNVTWILICFVVKCGPVGAVRIAVDRKEPDGRNFKPVTLKDHDHLKDNEKPVQGPK
jgi:hypothetical protein